MDLREIFEAFSGLGARVVDVTIGFDPGAGGAVHYCKRCGYQTTILEVMAIHAVNQHKFPFGVGDFGLEDPFPAGGKIVLADYVKHQSAIVITRFYESDFAFGPWTEIPPGQQPTKRYMRRVDTN